MFSTCRIPLVRITTSSPRKVCFSTTNNKVSVGIFFDLDNIQRTTIPTRTNVAEWLRPLKDFSRSVGKIDTMKGFGNVATQTWFARQDDDEKEEPFQQEFQLKTRTNEQLAQTGYDESGDLRCGVCGAKMRLTKKDKKRGLDVFQKLNKHMKNLHDREQKKRLTRMRQSKKKNKLTTKEQLKYQKYKEAQVGLRRIGMNSKGDIAKRKRNDLFQILKEQGVWVREAHDVDAMLITHAERWMKKTEKISDHSMAGVLVVVSGDSDFLPLLEAARAKGMLAVSAHPQQALQTRALVDGSDIVLSRDEDEDGTDCLVATATTPKGLDAMMDFESNTFPVNGLEAREEEDFDDAEEEA